VKALVIGNRDDADLGVLGEWMDARGMSVTTVDREDGCLPDLDGLSLIISMGSVWRVHDPDLEPLIRPEQALLRDAVAADVPVLAICFGMQQLTVAFGGEVFDTSDPEIGFRMLAPVNGAAVPRGPWMQFHYDACRLPPGAVELARNDHGLQAYRVGSALGVQFHPEVDEPVLRKWAEEGAEYLEPAGLSASWLLEETAKNVESSCAASIELFDTFWASR
jgi:GMP synthase-like glutamine amidotransferase